MNTAERTARRARLMPLALALALGAAVAGCEPSGEDLGTLTGAMPQAPPPVVVRDQVHHLTVALHGNAAADAPEWARIDHFLGAAAPGRPETVRLTIAGDAPPPLIDLVIHHAFAFGYAENKIKVAPPRGIPAHGQVTLELTTRASLAILPNCPQTTHLNLIDRDNRISSDWGCANVSALELQVADPHDLVQGESGGKTDSIMTTAAIHRLQTDKLKKLDTISSTSSVAGGTGGSGQ